MTRRIDAQPDHDRETHAQVRHYYGKLLTANRDLRTKACCSAEAAEPYLRAVLEQLDPEITERFYGCGSPIPLALAGCTVLDLGCGTGRDVYLASKLVGPRGRVIGVDMTTEQLEVACRHVHTQTERFGMTEPNVAFHHGCIEDLRELRIEDASVDVVISNCVINLSPDKRRVFSEALRVLKPGGELYFSDIFADRRVPRALSRDPLLRGECLGGAMYEEDFRRLLATLGCPDYRAVMRTRIEIDDPQIDAKAGMINFESVTVRAFKLDRLEDLCEDYGQVATYRGNITHAPHRFVLDDHHTFETGKPERVCGNTAAMLQDTRYGKHFDVVGDRSVHFGRFDCAHPPAARSDSAGACC